MSFTIMPLAQMSIKSGIIIILIAILRKIFLFRFPKRVFLSLWMIAITRLLIPLSVPVVRIPLLSHFPSWESGQIPPNHSYLPSYPAVAVDRIAPADQITPFSSIWSILWTVGFILTALYFLISYAASRLKFSESAAIENKDAELWLSQHPLRRSIQLRACAHITSPLTYGIFRPIILFPMDMDISQTNELHFILQHEYTHIKHFHGAIKLLIVLCLCLHWFNPAVWILYLLANKDMELFCDEMVLREHNGKAKTDYAHALIHMSMGPAANHHLHNNFSQRALKERIVAIMKFKKHSIFSLLLALVLAVSVTCTAFASAAPDTGLITEAGTPSSVEENYKLITENGDPSPAEDNPKLITEYGAPDDDEGGISPYATGSLLPGAELPIHRQTMYARQKVVLSVNYSPSSATIHIGIKNTATGLRTYYVPHNGTGTVSIPVTDTGTYEIFVRNASSVSVRVDLSYMVVT